MGCGYYKSGSRDVIRYRYSDIDAASVCVPVSALTLDSSRTLDKL